MVIDGDSAGRIFDAPGLEIWFDNVQVQNGQAPDNQDPDANNGGAVSAFQVGVHNSVFTDNDAAGGGAIFVSGSYSGQQCTSAPIARLMPGRLLGCGEGPSVEITGSEFTDNGTGSAIDGGAVYAMGGRVTATDSTFTDNEALLTGQSVADTDGAGGATAAVIDGTRPSAPRPSSSSN